MNKKVIFFLGILILITFFSIFYNTAKLQKTLKNNRQTTFDISLVNPPEKTKAETKQLFSWKVDAPNNFSTNITTLYWSYDSSPSALTKFDSPQAVGYPNYAYDYFNGPYIHLPDIFDVLIKFPKNGTVYYRAYAKIGEDHLWTPEYQLEVVEK